MPLRGKALLILTIFLYLVTEDRETKVKCERDSKKGFQNQYTCNSRFLVLKLPYRFSAKRVAPSADHLFIALFRVEVLFIYQPTSAVIREAVIFITNSTT